MLWVPNDVLLRTRPFGRVAIAYFAHLGETISGIGGTRGGRMDPFVSALCTEYYRRYLMQLSK